MVYVKLENDWTDADGINHSAGESIDVDAATLASLQAQGIVSEGPKGGGSKDGTDGWIGPTSTKP
ncbi:hypothetical protein AB0H57_12915 [Micromonospora sp. NPDC050686]|uniref:hypothetical protein n=1 Tax=Micromonospora sp. NPDC050686 TaxID=3154631 RepID=UPI0033E989E4